MGKVQKVTRNRKQYWYQMGKSYYFQGDYKNAKLWFGKMYGAMESIRTASDIEEESAVLICFLPKGSCMR